MATFQSMGNDVKLSFAKVAAASASKDSATMATATKANAPVTTRDKVAVPIMVVPTATAPAAAISGSASISIQSDVHPSQSAQETSDEVKASQDNIVEGLRDLKLETKTSDVSIGVPLVSSISTPSKVVISQTALDDNSRADSSSELGTKPPSLDGKSITSGTTFNALDEKESLRPDDSASMKAATEDDDAFSIRGSYFNGSRMGSEVAARIHRIQIGDMPPRTIITQAMTGGQGQLGLATPQSGISDKQPAAETELPLATGPGAPDGLTANGGFLSQHPDEKLLEAMRSEKDRFSLLKMEQQVIEFVENSKEPFMDFPPNNTFWRMLTHKLADYYHMTHSYEAVSGAVRIYRTPFCRIPPPLSTIAPSTSNTSSPAPAVIPRKIMRRGEDGEFAPSSANPSKPTSEAGSDPKDKPANSKERMTREEREEAYNRARQRIFGNMKESDSSGQDGEASNGISRASSVSAKDKPNGKKKANKQRRDDSESFDSRSQYVVYYGGQQSTWGPAPQAYPINNVPYNAQYQAPYPTAVPTYAPNQAYPQNQAYAQNQAYPQMVPSNGFGPQYGAMANYPIPSVPQPAVPVQQQQRYQPAPNPQVAPPYTPPMASVSQPAWGPPQQGFNQPGPGYSSRSSPSPGGIPYAYGQLPVNANPHDPKSQHPIPGSYNRQALNPKTQSFLPGNAMSMMQPPPGPYASSNHSSPQFLPAHINYGGYQQPMPPPPQPGYGGPGPMGYAMSRQGSNNSMGPYHHVPPQHHAMPPNASPHIAHGKVAGGPPPPTGPSGPQGYSHLPTYGNPASLPQKPPM
ncbi:hypothetical protein QBC32DRAFT_164412 [Pseudoneurospora amorphoporcata]|uniref:R3H domain-containing protein n=1 Tax=Pseudoneurospora amorphoporcata TaxID=241081 RepID=A0AAN6P5W0_9PEZI|nr:hypothetical protein QBC32DRAFT_164412 [Pseudoneurospora amorphoporcata]